MEQRLHGDRRNASSTVRLNERRTGFDRRRQYPVLEPLRNDPQLLGLLIWAFVSLSLIDGWLTAFELRTGMASEGNPLLATILAASPAGAVAFKSLATLLVSVAVWRGRRYRGILAVSVFGVAVYVAVLAYHLGSLWGALGL